MTWVDDLNDDDRSEWEAFVRHFREDTLLKIESSAFVASLVPGEFDVSFATELGTSIMLDKPIIAIVMPGRTITERLRRVADVVVEADIDTAEGAAQVAAALRKMKAQ